MSSSLPFRPGAALLLVIASAVSPVAASEAGKLLPPEAELILTLNVRQILTDHPRTEIVQRYLEPWRLAVTGDEGRLKKCYRDHDLLKTEGSTEEAFLKRAAAFKSVNDALGMDMLQDVERVTCGLKIGDGESWTLLVEGRFKEDRFRAGVKRLATEHFGSCKVIGAGPNQVWQVPDGADGVYITLLNARTLALTGSRKGMADLLIRAAGKANEDFSPGLRTLLDTGEKEHIAVVLNKADILLLRGVAFLEAEAARALGPTDLVEKLVVSQVVSAVRNYGPEFASASLGFSIGMDDLHLQFGFETKKAERARELAKLIDGANLWGALALKTSNNELAKQLADILLRERVAVKGTAAVLRVRVPHEFSKLVIDSPWFDLSALRRPEVEAVSRRIMSLPLWRPLKPPPGALEVEEVRDVAYFSGPNADPIRHRLDLFLPRGKKDYPVVVLVHGGAWLMGDNRCCGLYSSIGQFLASQGIGAVLPNYRLSPAVRHPEHIKDVARAVAWTHANIGRYGGSPRRLFLLGHSAGGHLVSLLATDESYLKAEGLKSTDIKGVITASGVYRIPLGREYGTLGGAGPRGLRVDQLYPLRGAGRPLPDFSYLAIPVRLNVFGSVFGDDPKERDKASPITHVRRGLPPFLILNGEKDLPGQQDMATDFHHALLREGCDARLLKVENRNHSSLLFSAIEADDPAARAVLEFVREHNPK